MKACFTGPTTGGQCLGEEPRSLKFPVVKIEVQVIRKLKGRPEPVSASWGLGTWWEGCWLRWGQSQHRAHSPEG